MSAETNVQLKRVLVLDDDELLCESIVTSISDRAQEIKVCRDVEHARDTINNWHPSMIIFDIMFPGGNLHHFVRELQRTLPTASTVAMSAYANRKQCFELGVLGVRAFLQKPFGLQELNEAIEKAISISPNAYQDASETARRFTLKEIESQVRSVMEKEVLTLCGNNATMTSRLISNSRNFIHTILSKIGCKKN